MNYYTSFFENIIANVSLLGTNLVVAGYFNSSTVVI